MKFGVFRNEHDRAEFAIQLMRDAKGMTYNPDKRYENSVDAVQGYVLIRFIAGPSIHYMKV